MNEFMTIIDDDTAATSVTTTRGDVRIRLTARASSASASQALCRQHIFASQAQDLASDDSEVEFLVLPTWDRPRRSATIKRVSS